MNIDDQNRKGRFFATYLGCQFVVGDELRGGDFPYILDGVSARENDEVMVMSQGVGFPIKNCKLWLRSISGMAAQEVLDFHMANTPELFGSSWMEFTDFELRKATYDIVLKNGNPGLSSAQADLLRSLGILCNFEGIHISELQYRGWVKIAK